jgi:arylsulfatase A
MARAAFSQEHRPNIIFILADDLGYTDLGTYGNPYNETPHLDKLAQQGAVFLSAYSSSPVCSPSRAAIMTGKHPARLRLTNYLVGERKDPASSIDPPADWLKGLPQEEITLADYLKSKGYRTGMVGKWHLGSGRGQAPWGQGFDYTRLIDKNGLDYYNYTIAMDGYEKQFKDDGSNYLTDKLTGYALEFIAKSEKEKKPFFLYLCYSAPHVLLVPRGDKVAKYLWKYEKFEGAYNPYYAAMIESVDDGVGTILNDLAEKKLLENTLVIFTSDNGGVGLPELGPVPTRLKPYRKWKGHTYEGGIKVPAIFFWKGKIKENQTCDSYFSNTDYFATIRNVVEDNVDTYHDGQSIWPLISGKKNIDRPIFWHYPHFSNQMGRPSGAVRVGNWKMIVHYETKVKELYHLASDAGEEIDLAAKYPEKLQELTTVFKQWLIEVNAQLPIDKMTHQPILGSSL